MLNEAYEILMDPEMRTAYNADLDTALQVRRRRWRRCWAGAAAAACTPPSAPTLVHPL